MSDHPPLTVPGPPGPPSCSECGCSVSAIGGKRPAHKPGCSRPTDRKSEGKPPSDGIQGAERPVTTDHPPLTAVAAALHEAIGGDEYCVCRDECQSYARIALRALATDPVREWAARQSPPCLRWGEYAPCDGERDQTFHPECLLAALAPPEQP